MYLGTLSLRQPLLWFFLSVESSGSGTIDFDSVALLAVDNPITSQAVAILPDETAVNGKTLSSPRTLVLNHAIDFDIRPHVYIVDGSSILFQSYTGNPAFFVGANEPAVAAAWLSAGAYWYPAYWRATDSGGTVISNILSASRMKGQLTLT
jgi:hypothetical protein